MKTFDVEAARKSGYTDGELATFLSQKQNFDLDGARNAGYSDGEILERLGGPAPQKMNPETDILGKLGRQVGLTARAGIQGLTAIPNLIGDAVGLESSKTVSNALTGLGLPQPQDATERVASDVTGAMAGGGGMIQLGRKMVGAATPFAQRIGGMFSASPTAQTVANATGAGAAGVTRESGGSDTQQMIAALMGSTAPGMVPYTTKAATRGLVRGGEQGRNALTEGMRLLMETGTPPTVGLATGNRRTQVVESVLSKSPGGAGRMADTATNISASMGNRVQGVADDLAPNADPTRAGMAIERGIRTFVDDFQTQQTTLYNKLDNYIAQDDPISVAVSQRALTDLTKDIKGAPSVSEILRNPRIKAIADAFAADSGTGTLPYSAIKELRTEIGKVIAEGPLISGAPTNQWKRLYGALSSDMELAARAAGSDAERAFSRANSYTRAGMERIDTHLDRAIRPTAEATYKTLVSDPGNASKIAATLKSLGAEERQVVKATFIDRMGKAAAGRQDAAGEVFSSEVFLTNWNRLDARSKAVLFAGQDGRLRDDLDKIAQVADRIRQGSKVFANPSGTAGAAASAAPLVAAGAALSGSLGTAASILAVMGVANLSARAMTYPPFVHWLARATDAPSSALPALTNALAQIRDQAGDSTVASEISEITQAIQQRLQSRERRE